MYTDVCGKVVAILPTSQIKLIRSTSDFTNVQPTIFIGPSLLDSKRESLVLENSEP